MNQYPGRMCQSINILCIIMHQFFSRRLNDLVPRVECRINGTFDPLSADTNPDRVEQSILSALLRANYLVVDTNNSNSEL